MTNRERYITKRNEYDLMLMMKENLTRIGVYCPIDCITGRKPKCRLGYYDETMTMAYRDCESCIQTWLNEKYTGR